jgi:hypothetical protein
MIGRNLWRIVIEALLGFYIGFWDCITFLAILVILIALRATIIVILGLPGRIASVFDLLILYRNQLRS